MAPISPSKALSKLQQLQKEQGDPKKQLAILRISESILATEDIPKPTRSPSKRRSDASTDALDTATPSSLEADLTHYKELFSKLRFSYIEQVTKEKFLRAIVGDPPLVVGHNENVELEAQLAEVKAELKQRKEEVRVMVEEMETMGRDLAKQSIENLESTIATLRAKQVTNDDASSSQNLPLPATLALLSEREAELAAVNRQLASLQNTLPRKTREAEAMERELGVLERKKGEAVAQAKEAQRRKREGESDGLEEMGRWYRGTEESLKQLLGVEG
ncbi:hypothetical protein Plec18167_007533 [Paecilomyces lecythidis]|uniref:Kinetochore protein Sos7 coiled-coil domain-containing protein n=1 Tax=Paecilomyces lecythidis TaxID=3004212 RepID=A0ABR3X3D2_9EURO